MWHQFVFNAVNINAQKPANATKNIFGCSIFCNRLWRLILAHTLTIIISCNLWDIFWNFTMIVAIIHTGWEQRRNGVVFWFISNLYACFCVRVIYHLTYRLYTYIWAKKWNHPTYFRMTKTRTITSCFLDAKKISRWWRWSTNI